MSKFTHPQYDDMLSRWTMARDSASGEHDVHKKGMEYLPRLSQESNEDYRTRLLMTPFFGATWRTIISLRGMMFRKPPSIIVPSAMEDDLDNIDNDGRSIISFAQKISIENLTVGRVGVMVDFPSINVSTTRADSMAMGVRAFLVKYEAESILNWGYENIVGRRVLSIVRLREDPSEFRDIELERGQEIHRILMLDDGGYLQKIMLVNGEIETQIGADIIPMMGGSRMNFIPFQLEVDLEAPPLIDLVTLNLHHYRQSSSYERGCFISGLPTMMIYGNNDEDKNIYVGGSLANSFPDPDTRAEFVEVKSNFQSLVDNLDRKEKQMAVLGARMLESQKKGVESGEALQRKQSGEESVLADMAETIGDGLTEALKWYADWQGYESQDISIALNKEFLPFEMDAQQITAMMSVYLQNGMSFDTLYFNYKRAGMYPPESTQEDERGMIDENTIGL